MDLDLHLRDCHIVVTGGSGFIGAAVVSAFLSAGSCVSSLDLRQPQETEITTEKFQYLQCDISSETQLTSAFAIASQKYGPISTCIALAGLDYSFIPHHESLADMSTEQWRRTHAVNVEGTFLTARTWLRHIRDVRKKGEDIEKIRNVGLVIVGSESGMFGVRGNADYAAGKSAVQGGLLLSLADDVVRIWPGARVNAVAPGPVDTEQFRKECAEAPGTLYYEAEATTALRKPIPPESVAKTILFLASENWSSSITGQVLRVDSGKMGRVMWTKEEC